LQTHMPKYLSIEEWDKDPTIQTFLKKMGYHYNIRLDANNIYTQESF
jgi:hypothetical protein